MELKIIDLEHYTLWLILTSGEIKMVSRGIKRELSEKDKVLNEIIEREQIMFNLVHNIGGRTNCQEDNDTFYIMRYSQQHPFSMEMLASYLEDLKAAKRAGRNLLTEKYGYMMADTEPEYFEKNLKHNLPEVTPEKEALVKQITKKMLGYQNDFMIKYPHFSRRVRTMDAQGNGTSIGTYMIGELKTYSMKTLNLYEKDIMSTEKGIIVEKIQEITASFYGYEGLEEAERIMKIKDNA